MGNESTVAETTAAEQPLEGSDSPAEGTPDEEPITEQDAAEQPEQGDDEASEPEQEPDHDEDEPQTPQQPDTSSRLEQVSTALERRAKSYGKSIGDILGDDWMGLQPCPLCSEHFPGLLTPAPPSEQAITAVRAAIGLPDLSNYRPDPYARQCDVCGGQTKTLTGSLDPRYATKKCTACNGTGFRDSDPHAVKPLVSNGGSVDVPPTHEDAPPSGALPPAAVEALRVMLASAENAAIG